MMSRSRRALMLGALAIAAACAAPTAGVAQSKWDLSTVWPDGNFHTKNAVRFAADVKAATKGAVDIAVKSGGQLGFKGPEHLRAVRDGLVPIADILNIQQIGDEPLLGIESIAFLVSSPAELKLLHKHIRPIYEQIAARNNQKILYMVPWPTQYLHLKVKSNTLDGLKGVKIRVPDKGAADMLTLVGMAPVLIPWGETIPALASGVVAGVSTSAVSGVDGKFWEFLKYVYPTNHVWSSQMMNVNLDAWKKLSPEHQKAIEDLARKLEPEFWDVSVKADADSLAKLKAQGMEVVELPPAMMADLRAKTANILNEYMKRVPASQPAIKAYLAEVKR
ncbi:MAG TPA: TRAP transporter substrate-binding protein [Hyphomicrobiaceae bacterium]|nr:TRAP transporter substrate-binding protein [Hyphomicrobiaceae bacterium]